MGDAVNPAADSVRSRIKDGGANPVDVGRGPHGAEGIPCVLFTVAVEITPYNLQHPDLGGQVAMHLVGGHMKHGRQLSIAGLEVG